MGDIAIRMEEVSKRYSIKSLQDSQQGARLRDVLTDRLQSWGQTLLRPFGVKQTGSPTRQDFWALRDVSFEVHRGEILGLIGRNGAGKSTLLKIISRITAPTRGWLSIRGRIVSLLEVGTGFNADLTGRENVFLNGAIVGMKRAKIAKKFDEIVAFAEVEKFIDMPVRFYSSGMYSRLAFAVAIHQDPEILILDEVLAVGDFLFQKKCIEKMTKVASEGHTVLFVSHSPDAVQKFCSRALYLEAGRVVAVGEVQPVLQKYLQNQGGTTPSPEGTHPPQHANVA